MPLFVNLSRTRRCSWCGSSDVRPSRFRLYDLPLALLLLRPHRCRACYERNFSFLWARYKAPRPPNSDQIDRPAPG